LIATIFAAATLFLSLTALAAPLAGTSCNGDPWELYLRCVLHGDTSATNEALCRAYIAEVRQEIARLEQQYLSITPIPCDDACYAFTGTGVFVSKKACEPHSVHLAASAQKGFESLLGCLKRLGNRDLFHDVAKRYMESWGGTGTVFVMCVKNKDDGYSPDEKACRGSTIAGQVISFCRDSDLDIERTMGRDQDAATFGHEFLHYSAVDNQETGVHNDPDATTPGRDAPNRYYDRVYSCQKMCFLKDFLSREECSACLSYSTKDKKLPGVPKQCEKLISAKFLYPYSKALEDYRLALNSKCNEALSRSRMLDLLKSPDGDRAALAPKLEELRTDRERARSCRLSAGKSLLGTADKAIANSGADARSATALRVERFSRALDDIGMNIDAACTELEEVRLIRQEQERCKCTVAGKLDLAGREKEERKRAAENIKAWNAMPTAIAGQDLAGFKLKRKPISGGVDSVCGSWRDSYPMGVTGRFSETERADGG
jgi:hypothetical protein